MNPDQKPTVPLSPEAIVHGRLDQVIVLLGGLQTQMSSVVVSQGDVVTRLDRIEKWKTGVEERLSRNSERVGTTTQNDLKQDAAIAKIVVDVARVEVKLDENTKTTEAIRTSQAATAAMVTTVHGAVTGFFKSEKVKTVGRVIWILALAVSAILSAKGMMPK